MGEKSSQGSDGMVLAVKVAPIQAGGLGEFIRAFEHVEKAARCQRRTVRLGRRAGRNVRIRFITDCGPSDNVRTEHAYWTGAWLLGPQGRKLLTPPVRFMSWCNRHPLEARFYFLEVRSGSIDLVFRIGGSEPVWIGRFTMPAHPDVMYPGFRHGLVRANPSHHPYEFDVGRLCPRPPVPAPPGIKAPGPRDAQRRAGRAESKAGPTRCTLPGCPRA